MVKSYLKFEHSKTFGQVATPQANAVWLPDEKPISAQKTTAAGRAVVGANEDVLCWDIKKGELLNTWKDNQNHSIVTVICRSQVDEDIFAVGYDDGKIRLWDSKTATIIISFNGHKSAVTQLAFDPSGAKLASGSKDTDIILWDLVGEVGLFKLRGHKDQITSLGFLQPQLAEPEGEDGLNDYAASAHNGFLLSTSKDSLLKMWDLSMQYCVETHVAQANGECWALGLSPDHSGCITAGNDGELRVWSIDISALKNSTKEQTGSQNILKDRGSFYRHGKDRTTAVHFHPRLDYVAVHGSEKAVELWRIRNEGEIQKSLARKRKRRREKLADTGMEQIEIDDTPIDVSKALVAEVFVPYVVIRTGGKVRSMDWAGAKSGKSISIMVSTTNNLIELYNVAVLNKKIKSDEPPEYNRSLAVDVPGHRTDIRCVALSSDDRMLASASQGSLKIWNVRTQSCIRDKIVVIGTRDGNLELFDISSSTLLDTIKAHDRDIWSLQVHPDGRSLMSGSADKTAKFWEFKVIQEEILGTNRKMPKLTLVHSRTLKVADDILAVRFSPDARLVAVSTLDNTVKVFFTDSLSLFLTLYGHKLPVLSMDISYDSKLIVTSSADKNVRVWGLDFGDCHKAFFAHQDSIMSVSFMPNNNEGNGHHFFSASKDHLVKYYDGDKFEQIQKLDGHHGEIWAMAVSHDGEFLITASHDKSVRLWQQTDEQIFLEEEREKELEELYENTLVTSLDAEDNREGDETVQSASKPTLETLTAGEKIAEALTLGIEDLDLMSTYYSQKQTNPNLAPPQRNPIFLAHNNISASDYVLKVFSKISTSSLQDALLVLSFTHLPSLFTFLGIWVGASPYPESEVPQPTTQSTTPPITTILLTSRILFFILRLHHRQLTSSRLMRPLLETIRTNLRQTLRDMKNVYGYNLAGLRVLARRLGEREEGGVFVGAAAAAEEGENVVDGKGKGKKGVKRGFVNVA
ncbi:putative wd domain protein [Phaeomoniella chlamydospora]|uniref:Putative wd domain protein n=1 Tax=Phaeomoniella chlamydospora TaxID=158046 RepID=A0A0G2GQ44_PHACM|nr:putative wd domain protein [Phaeomoniella chlamydospora]